MSTYKITNVTKNKVVLNDVKAADAIDAAGQYISMLMLAGIVSFCQKEVAFVDGAEADFSLTNKNWDFKVELVA